MRNLQKSSVLAAGLLAVAFLLTAFPAKAQQTPEAAAAGGDARPPGVFIENGGFGGIVSVNFERRFAHRFNARIGIAAFDGAKYPLLPFSATVIVSRNRLAGNSHIELGVASLFRPEPEGTRRLAGAAMVAAWRQHFAEGRWYYQISYHSAQDRIWPALSLGRGW